MATSLRKLYANRRNARLSTGPRTAAGKARSSQNARKHGLALPALRDPAKTRNIAELARKLAGPTADATRFEAACRLVAAQIDLLDIRAARLPLLSRAPDDRSAIKRLHSIDRYERYARSGRSRALRDFGSVRPPDSTTTSGQAIGADSCGEAFDIAAVLRKPVARKRARAQRRRIGVLSRRRGKACLAPTSRRSPWNPYLRFGRRRKTTV